MVNKGLYNIAGMGAVVATLAVSAQSANAFIITNTSASWDNVSLNTGEIVGSQGVAPSTDNLVNFLDIDGQNQVRWGEAAYGGYWEDNWEEVTHDVQVEKTRKVWVPKYNKRGRFRGYRKVRETYYETQSVTEWVNNKRWVPPTYRNQSGLGYAGVSDLNISVGEVFNIGTLTHFNQTIYDKVGERAEFSLDLDFGESSIGSQSFNFAFSIDETLNQQTVCPYITVGNKGCSDQITWDFSIDESSRFTYNEDEYSLELVGFSQQVANSSIVNEFISQEKADNSASLFARLVKVNDSEQIPEPASLLGLAGLGLFVVNAKKKR
ncbi:MAG: choice-of-anchor K domain-containing protein [Cyanobacteria bacterium J06573_11]